VSDCELFDGQRIADDRGFLQCFNSFDFRGSNIRRLYVVTNHLPGFIRPWHGHERETKWVTCLRGTVIIGSMPLWALADAAAGHGSGVLMQRGSWQTVVGAKRVILSSDPNPSLLKIPPGYANSSRILTADAQLLYFSDMTTDESLGDDIRYSTKFFPDIWEVVER